MVVIFVGTYKQKLKVDGLKFDGVQLFIVYRNECNFSGAKTNH